MARGKDTGKDPSRKVERPLTLQQSRWFGDYEDDRLNPPIGTNGPAAKATGRI